MNLQERKEVEDLKETVGKALNKYLEIQGCNEKVDIGPSRINFGHSKVKYYAFRKYPVLINANSPSARRFLQNWILRRKQTIWRRLTRFAIKITHGKSLFIFPSLIIKTEKEAVQYLKDAILIADKFVKLVDLEKMTITSILKTNVSKSYMEDEVKVRKLLSDNTHIPKLIEYNDKGNFYTEEFFNGIPLSHHTIPKNEKIRVLREAVKLLYASYEKMGHKREVNLNEYLTKRKCSIEKSLERIGGSRKNKEFLISVRKIFKKFENIPASSTVTLICSPSDRKLGQILYHPHTGKFKMIDWESLSPTISITHDAFQLLEGLFGRERVLKLIKTGQAERNLMDLYEYFLNNLNLKNINPKQAYGIYFIERIDGNFSWLASKKKQLPKMETMLKRWEQRIQDLLSVI